MDLLDLETFYQNSWTHRWGQWQGRTSRDSCTTWTSTCLERPLNFADVLSVAGRLVRWSDHEGIVMDSPENLKSSMPPLHFVKNPQPSKWLHPKHPQPPPWLSQCHPCRRCTFPFWSIRHHIKLMWLFESVTSAVYFWSLVAGSLLRDSRPAFPLRGRAVRVVDEGWRELLAPKREYPILLWTTWNWASSGIGFNGSIWIHWPQTECAILLG